MIFRTLSAEKRLRQEKIPCAGAETTGATI
jgi:hypothetical protein